MSRYKVLWIDDQPSDEFINEAAEYDIDIEVALCHNDGVRLLRDMQNNWDAIILDASCKIFSENESPSLNSLRESILHMDYLSKTGSLIPYFIYTGGGYEGYGFLSTLIPKNRDWDNRDYYNKPSQRYELFENLKKAADNRFCTQIKHKYDDLFSWIPVADKLLKILMYIETFEFSNMSCLNEIRKMLEWVRNLCIERGLLPEDVKGLNKFSRFLCDEKMKDYIPIYIQRSLHSCIVVTQEGSHLLSIDKAMKNGEAPYLLRSTVFELLNVLYWCKSLPSDENSIEAMRVKTATLIPSVSDDAGTSVFEGVIKKDANHNYFCGEYLLNYRDMQYEDIGKRIKIKKCAKNTQERTKDFYPFFVAKQNFEILDQLCSSSAQ